MKFRLLLLLAAFLHAGCCFMPSRVGQLVPTGAPGSVSGLVFLLNHTAIYIRDFQFDMTGRGVFCAGSSIADTSDAYTIPFTPNSDRLTFQTGYSSPDIELQLPEGKTMASVGWIGVCRVNATRILASVIVQPETVANVPCETTFIGELPAGSNGLAGRVYLLNRITFAVVGFSYDGQAEDALAFFWVGSGETPSISGYACTYNQDINSRLPAVQDQDVVVHLPSDAEGKKIEHFAIWCRSNNINIGHIAVQQDLIPNTEKPPALTVPKNSPVFLGSLTTNSHGVQGNIFALDERTLMLTEFSYDGTAPAARFYAVRGDSVRSPEFWILRDENGSTDKLSEYANATIVITLPDEITVHTIDWFSVWCVQFNVSFGELQIPDEIPLQPEVPASAVFLGSLTTNSHGVRGFVFALDERTLMLTEFSYDGSAPAARFYAVRGDSVRSPEYWILRDENGSDEKLSEYANATIVLTLPDEITVHTIDWFSVWCVQFNVSFGELQIPDEIPLQPEVPASAVFLGSLTTNSHGVHGFVFALDERTLMLTEFSYDGSAPAARFYAVRGDSVRSPEFWILRDENGSTDKLSEYVNATIVITLPDEITVHTIDWFSVWCVQFNVSFGELQIPDEIPLQPEVPASAVFLGSLTTNSHGVRGFVFALDERTLMLTEFSYDGSAPAARFYAVRGDSVRSPEFWILRDENGSTDKLSEYVNATIVITLPDEITVHTIDWFSVWCVQFNVSFGELQIPDEIPLQPEVPASAVFLGSLTTNSHGVRGFVFALDERTLMLTEFSYDGSAPAARFYAVRGDSVRSPEFWILRDENGSTDKLSEYVNATIVVTLPDEITVHTIDWFSVWCVQFNVSFGELQIPDEIPLQPEVPASAVFLGSLTTNSHGVRGFVFALDERTLMLTEFSYDGSAPAARFYAVRGDSVRSPEYWILRDENGSDEKLSEYANATIVITLPDEITVHTIDWFSVWCVQFNVSFGELQIPDEIPLQPEVPASAVFLGSLTTNSHGVRGFVFALDERTLMLTEFSYDGSAPAARFYAVRGDSVRSPEFWILRDENGSTDKLSEYVNATIVIILPDEITVHTIDWFSVWCVQFNVSFGELLIPDDLPAFASAAPTPATSAPRPSAPTLPPVEECSTLESEQPVNCKQLSENVKMSWVIDRITDTIYITLCGCVQPDNYIAFGLSGSVNRVQMVRGDVTWTWLDSEGVHAQDLDLSAYAQCFMTRRRRDGRILQSGVCPDVQNDVFSVSGYREGCTTCITYAKPLQTTDPTDIPILLDREQYVIWSMGPVGSLVTPLDTTIPVPFRHFVRANPTDDLRVNFSRTPVDECNLQCTGCSAVIQPWPRPVLEHTTTINARIGQSGSEKGYAGITGTAGWGIAWYLNGLLIPNVTVFRGTTYTFKVEGGENPDNSARYHPFYISDNQRGGYLAKVEAARQQETVYAGFAFDEDTKPLGVGRYCEYKNIRGDRSSEFDSFEDYKSSLELECDEGEAGSFTWTPDENTPDIVYYQCATHQFLGWSMQVKDAATTSSPPVVINGGPSVNPPIPGEGEDNSQDDDSLNFGGLNGDVHTSAALRLIMGALSFTILVIFSL